jgi:hypothetical protein
VFQEPVLAAYFSFYVSGLLPERSVSRLESERIGAVGIGVMNLADDRDVDVGD